MRAVFVVCVAVMVAVASASAGESDSAVEVDHPVLPGLGSACLPQKQRRNWRAGNRRPVLYQGLCTTEAACPEAMAEPGYCAGVGVTCCKTGVSATAEPQKWVNADDVTPAVAPAANAVPILRSTTSACATQKGTCGTPAACAAKGGRTQSGLCPGSSTNICCFTTTPPPTGQSLSALVAIPAGINPGLTIAGASGLTAKIGSPGCPLTTACFSCTCATNNAKITRNKITLQITPNFRLTGLKPYVEAVKRAFDAIKAGGATNPLLTRVYNEAKTAGGLCCRPIKRSNGTAGKSYSNHSWGAAADFYFGANIDPRGDGKTQYGLLLMAPYFAREKLYWAAGYRGSEEDAMHFEASAQALATWTL